MVVSPHERLSDEALRTVLSTVYALDRAKVDVDGYNLSNEFHTLCSNVIGIITSTLGEKFKSSPVWPGAWTVYDPEDSHCRINWSRSESLMLSGE